MNKAKLVLGLFIALVVVLFAGWFWGASGTADLSRRLEASELRNDLLTARGSVLDARLALYSVNFGEASRHLEEARGALRRAEAQLETLGRPDDVKQLKAAFARIDESQQLAGKLDQTANARAADAAKTIDEVPGAAVTR
jgi:hypothetical protein